MTSRTAQSSVVPHNLHTISAQSSGVIPYSTRAFLVGSAQSAQYKGLALREALQVISTYGSVSGAIYCAIVRSRSVVHKNSAFIVRTIPHNLFGEACRE
jgi:hypothetical protein